MKLNDLIIALNVIKDKYGDLNVELNELNGEHYYIKQLCVDTTSAPYTEDNKPELLIEFDSTDNYYIENTIIYEN